MCTVKPLKKMTSEEKIELLKSQKDLIDSVLDDFNKELIEFGELIPEGISYKQVKNGITTYSVVSNIQEILEMYQKSQ